MTENKMKEINKLEEDNIAALTAYIEAADNFAAAREIRDAAARSAADSLADHDSNQDDAFNTAVAAARAANIAVIIGGDPEVDLDDATWAVLEANRTARSAAALNAAIDGFRVADANLDDVEAIYEAANSDMFQAAWGLAFASNSNSNSDSDSDSDSDNEETE